MRLAEQDSATAVLTGICGTLHPGEHRRILAEHVQGVTPPDGSDAFSRLAPGPDQAVQLRHVRLTCEGETLSEAWNWYVPSRLPDEVNRQLDNSNTPFGRALSAHGFTRKRLWSRHGKAGACPQATALSQAAVLYLPGSEAPVSYVLECYTQAALRR